MIRSLARADRRAFNLLWVELNLLLGNEAR